MEGKSRAIDNRIWGAKPPIFPYISMESPSMFSSLSNYSNDFKLDQTTLTNGLLIEPLRPLRKALLLRSFSGLFPDSLLIAADSGELISGMCSPTSESPCGGHALKWRQQLFGEGH